MPALRNLVGQRFGRWIVVERRGRDSGHAAWLCRCDCGNERTVSAANLRSGASQSCGCLHRERASQAKTTHGGCGTSEYRTWRGIINRCTDPNQPRFKDYGGRGIRVCDRWRHSFENFLADVGPRPEGSRNGRAIFSLDRIDNDGDYEPGNCRWTTNTVQTRNARSNVKITHGGVTMCLSAWGEKLGIPYITLKWRRARGWSDHEVLFGRSSQR